MFTSKCLLSGSVAPVFFACLNTCVTNLRLGPFSSLRLLNVCFRWLDATAADSRPVHLPEAECQGIMRHLVVKFRIWQNALKPSRMQMQREQPGPKWWLPISYWLYHISLCFQPNKWPQLCSDCAFVWTQVPVVCHIRYSDTSDKRNYW